MQKQTALLTTLGFTVSISAQAASLDVGGKEVELSGGVAASATYAKYPNAGTGLDYETLESGLDDAILRVSSGKVGEGEIGFEGAVGAGSQQTLLSQTTRGTVVFIPEAVLKLQAMEELGLEMGRLATKIGYESSYSFANDNFLRGLVWNEQPAFYNGTRANVELDGFGFYAEISNPPAGDYGNRAWAIGMRGGNEDFEFLASFFNGDKSQDVLDVVANIKAGDFTIGVNADLYLVDNPAAGQDDSALAAAAYMKLELEDGIELPIRAEYINDGNSGIFGVNNALSFTFSPTLKLDKGSYIRGEAAVVRSDNDIFYSTDNLTATADANTQLSLALQVGMIF